MTRVGHFSELMEGKRADVILSDMAPNLSGVSLIDQVG